MKDYKTEYNIEITQKAKDEFQIHKDAYTAYANSNQVAFRIIACQRG